MYSVELWYCVICKEFICQKTAWGARLEKTPEQLLEKHRDATTHNKFKLETEYQLDD